MTLTLNRPWSNVDTAHGFITLDICANLFVNPTSGSKDIERTRKRAGQTDRQTGTMTETERHKRVVARRFIWLAMWRHLVFVAVINELSVCLTTCDAHCFLFSCAVIWRRSSYLRTHHDCLQVPIMISSDEMRNEIHLSRDGQASIRTDTRV